MTNLSKIKCRAWDETNRDWVNYGFCLRFDSEGTCEMLNAFAEPFTDRKLIPVFWTGQKDKNGHEVYSGDIVRYEDIGVQGIVAWSETYPGFIVLNPQRNGAYVLHNEWEVIGNVYEHPDLLPT